MPIYVADTLKPELPNKAVTRGKKYSEWLEMADEDFIFSLYPNDLICATSKNGITLNVCRKDSTLPPTVESKSFMLYYRGTNISTGGISCITHDNAYEIGGLGVKTHSGCSRRVSQGRKRSKTAVQHKKEESMPFRNVMIESPAHISSTCRATVQYVCSL